MSQLDEIGARIADCKTYNFGMRNADTLAHFDAPFLLALVREQAAKLEAVRELHDFHFQGDAKKCDTCQVSGYALPWPCETVDALEASA